MINKLAVVETDQIGVHVSIGEFSIVRKNVKIGNNVIIHPHVIIEENAIIGDDTEIFPGTYIGKTPKGAGATARPIEFKKEVKIGNNCAVGPNAVIFYDVEIGNNTLIGDGASLREGVIIGNKCLISRYVTVNYNTKIGSNTKIMDLCHITGNCEIGNNVFISVLVSTTNDNIVKERLYEDNRIIGPKIEDDVTIGASASLLPNIKISKGAFVGVGSVVTKDVQENTLVIGVPARVIRKI